MEFSKKICSVVLMVSVFVSGCATTGGGGDSNEWGFQEVIEKPLELGKETVETTTTMIFVPIGVMCWLGMVVAYDVYTTLEIESKIERLKKKFKRPDKRQSYSVENENSE